jgi:hypothetical protein
MIELVVPPGERRADGRTVIATRGVQIQPLEP